MEKLDQTDANAKLQIKYTLTSDKLDSIRHVARRSFIQRWGVFLAANVILLVSFFAVLGVSGLLQALCYEVLLLLGMRVYQKEAAVEILAKNRTYIRHRIIKETVEFSAEGVNISADSGYFCDWLLFSRYKETKDFLILYSKSTAFVFPKSAFSGDELRFVMELIQSHIG